MSSGPGVVTSAPSVVVSVPIGPKALGALAGVVRAAKRADPLAPVTVIVPSSHVGVSVRRHLARLRGPDGRAGLVNVQWRALGDVAGQLAGGELVRRSVPTLTPPVRRAAIRAALDQDPGRFAAVAGNPATERSLDATFTELRDLDPDDLSVLERSGPRGRDVVGLFLRARAIAVAFADERDLIDLATGAVDDPSGDPLVRGALAALGHVVVYLPTTMSPAEVRLLAALARHEPVSVVVGTTGDPAADAESERVRATLVEALPALDTALGGSGPVDAGPTELHRAPDPDEEVRLAVRRVIRALADGVLPEDIAIVTRVAQPYDTLLAERLRAAGVAHHAPASSTLAQTVAGRALLGFLGVAARGFRRAELFRWVRSAPIKLADGRSVPRSFDRTARQAGIAGGLDQWHQRLDRRRDELALEPERNQYRLRDVDDLRAFVDELHERAIAPVGGTWVDHATWATALLERLVGSRTAIAGGRRPWPVAEVEAYDRVVQVIETLGGLDAIEPAVDGERFLRVLADELDAPVRAPGTFGHGVFVGRLDELVGAHHDLVLVLGMAEGWFPPRGRSDPILPEAERRLLDGRLAARRRPIADEHRAFLAAMAAAPTRVLSFPRVDSRNQRELLPARAFVRAVRDATGVAVRADGLDALAELEVADVAEAPGGRGLAVATYRDTASFLAGVVDAPVAIDEHERAVAALLAGAAPSTELARGIEAVRARVDGDFNEWTGWAGPEHAPRFVGDRVGSSTSFEQWATCPFRYFLGHVLAIRPLDEYADAESISRLDRGSLVHAVMERFIAEHLDDRPGQAWGGADHGRVRELIAEVAREYEEQGRTGRPLLWQVELDRIGRLLATTLDADEQLRLKAGVHPLAVELAFGIGEDDESPPVVFELGSGRRVAFRGLIDRVDRDPDDGALVVLDYKTGKDDGYDGLDRDITARGRHLQLVIYSEAARARFGGDEVEAYYWFVEKWRGRRRLGGPIGPVQRQRFLDVLQVVVDGIEGGRFPANPGEANFWGFSHCGFCDFDRICPSSRDDLWEGVRLSGPLADYVELAEGEPPGGDDVGAASASGRRGAAR